MLSHQFSEQSGLITPQAKSIIRLCEVPVDHPRYHSLVTREHLARMCKKGNCILERLTAHGRGEAFDYLLGERTTKSACLAERTAAAMLLTSPASGHIGERKHRGAWRAGW